MPPIEYFSGRGSTREFIPDYLRDIPKIKEGAEVLEVLTKLDE